MAITPYTIEKISIQDFAAEGVSVARHNDWVVFVENAIPGDIVDVLVFQKKKNFLRGKVQFFHEYSKDRQSVFCEHFGTCGGCKWQHVNYKKQLEFKNKQVYQQLWHIGKLKLPDFLPIIGAEKQEFYRNKLEYTFSNNRWLTVDEKLKQENLNKNVLGFHIPQKFDKILQINKCYLQADPSNEIRNFTYEYAQENKLTFFDIRQQTGFLRNLVIRTSNTGDCLLIVIFFYEDELKRKKLLQALRDNFPNITSIFYIINDKKNDSYNDLEPQLYHGKAFMSEKMEELIFQIGPKSFFQTNSDQALKLYQTVRECAKLTNTEIVYDLYTGTGTIANFLAKKAKKVIGIEYIPEAITDAKKNSINNQITNTDFFAGDMKDIFTELFIDQHGKADVIITDPPRAGMHEKVIEQILKMGPKRIVYVSCNPATQARDLQLMQNDYTITSVQAFDLFPHTHHIESIVVLEKK